MKDLCLWLTTAAMLGISACAHTKQGSAERPVAMSQEPHHRLVFQNEFVRIVDINVPPGDTSLFHIHADPMVSITIRDATTWSQKPGDVKGQRNEAEPAPFVGTNWDQPLPMVHRVANVDTTSYRRIAAEWLRSPGIDCKVLESQSGMEIIHEGRFGRVYERRLGAQDNTAVHTHSCPTLVVLGAGSVLETTQGPLLNAGNWVWLEAGSTHVLRSTDKGGAVVYEIHWR